MEKLSGKEQIPGLSRVQVDHPNKKTIVVSLSLLIILVSFSTGYFDDDKEKKGVVKIISVSYEPQNPMPGDTITITAIVENSSLIHIQISPYFGTGAGSSGYMPRVKDKTYESTVGPYENGTELWFMLAATGYNGTFVISEEYTIQIGELERSNKTTLSISNVSYSPQQPTINNTSVTVSAKITSNVNLTEIGREYMKFYPYGSGGGGGSTSRIFNDVFEDEITLKGFDGEGPQKGTVVFFRVVAQDESGNTAVTRTHNFTIS